MPSSADLRVSDDERDRAVERLRAAAGEGRLATDELEDRISDALGARTHGDLQRLLADLPGPRLPAPRTARAPVPPAARRELLRRKTVAFLSPNVVCIAIWAATGAGSFWPKWILLVTGVWFGLFLVRYAGRVEHEHYDARGNPRRRHRHHHRRRRHHG